MCAKVHANSFNKAANKCEQKCKQKLLKKVQTKKANKTTMIKDILIAIRHNIASATIRIKVIQKHDIQSLKRHNI